MQLQHFENQFLPNALRKFFKETAPLSVRNDILSDLIAKFSERFCTCNPHLQLSQGMVLIMQQLLLDFWSSSSGLLSCYM